MTEKVKTHDKIIIASKKLFPIQGYKGTTMDMIAQEASIRKSLITYHFPKKQLILIEIMGTFLTNIKNFSRRIAGNDPLLTFFLTNYIFYTYLYNEGNVKFSSEILNRKDRNDLLAYENFKVLYIDIIKYFNINITFNTLVLREIIIYGSNKEVFNSYLSGIIKFPLDKIVEHITENTCRYLEISDHIIEEYKIKAKKLFSGLNYSCIKLF